MFEFHMMPGRIRIHLPKPAFHLTMMQSTITYSNMCQIFKTNMYDKT